MGMGLSKYEAVPKTTLFAFLLLCLLVGSAGGNLVLIGRNVSLTFPDVEANFGFSIPWGGSSNHNNIHRAFLIFFFSCVVATKLFFFLCSAPSVKGSGENGVLYVAEPTDACAPLTNEVAQGLDSRFALIIRGGCTFDVKVRSAQNAGFKAAIVYDNEDRGSLISMAGNSIGIHIHAVFVSKASGEILKKYSGRTDLELWIIPTFKNSIWSIMAISFISLLVVSAVLAMCFFIRRHHIRHERPRVSNVREFRRMSSQLVKAMPSLIFTSVVDDNCTSTTCAICLEDYNVGEKLRLLPCHHTTPSSNAGLSSFCSSMASSPAIEISPRRSQSNCQPHSFSSARSPATQIATMTPHSQSSSFSSACIANPQSSYGHSPAFRIGRSSLDPRNASSHRPQTYLLSSRSLEFPGSSSINSGLASSYILGSSYVSPSNLAASSSRQSYLRHCTESGASLSELASAQSPPGC
ncbi:receptor homology region, transmembrane domain- and RING domain-containing protein 1-like isoform X3 [Musa acuminata AAA Group]|uniref:receptor homology region, transmembrane domain- and RING domain-containing protein 1-like isoform X3 n=1 Tax=Musa acuminata AAA Group TaxID=214697 RepID=UPI0031D24A19